jgi:hypothetical protein
VLLRNVGVEVIEILGREEVSRSNNLASVSASKPIAKDTARSVGTSFVQTPARRKKQLLANKRSAFPSKLTRTLDFRLQLPTCIMWILRCASLPASPYAPLLREGLMSRPPQEAEEVLGLEKALTRCEDNVLRAGPGVL